MKLEMPASPPFLEGGGEMGALIRAKDWASTPLGPVQAWPQALRTALSIMLGSRYPMFLWWGPSLVNFYNDGYIPVLGKRHPAAIGRSAREVWAEIWDVLGPQTELVMKAGGATWNDRQLLVMERNGYVEETYFSWSYSPARDESGAVGGVFCACTEDTRRVLGERRLRTLREVADAALGSKDGQQACKRAIGAMARNRHDLPFVLVYLTGDDGEARLAGALGWDGAPARIPNAPMPDEFALPAAGVATPGAPWPERVTRALAVPVAQAGADAPAALLVAGISPRLALDDEYRGFIDLLAGQLAKALSDADAFAAQRRRMEALAELDRAKTAFFSNVSHEFRTPLTLMLGPLGDLLLQRGEQMPAASREALEVVQRNGQRLHKLVNTLLDFARIEAGRAQASYEPVDLAALTADLAANFRSACERAGIALEVDCAPVAEPAFVDREMWEKIVLNLVSNAFKFTLAGAIFVSLKREKDFVLEVRDTGGGIPAEALPRMFERFHRVEGARGRSHEGSGIGLALVQELVKLHGGSISVESEPGRGATFIVRIPRGAAHLPAEAVRAPPDGASPSTRAEAYVEEALGWLPGGETLAPRHSGKRVLLADDNADLRAYARRLLAEHYAVEAVADGEAALAAARARRPDLVLTDVMMPGLDGFALIQALRADEALRDIPVIALSARAGEEARLEGLGRGADEYLVKPFSARELLVRVETLLRSAELRREHEQALRASEERYRSVLGLMPAGVYTCEAPSGVITYYNHHAAVLWGRAPALGDTDERFCGSFRLWRSDGTLLPHAETPMALALREGREFRNQEVVIERPDGSRITALVNIDPMRDAHGRMTGAVNVFQNITERKRAQEQLRDYLEGLLEGFVAYDENWVMTYMNAAGERLLGRRREDVLGKTWHQAFPHALGNPVDRMYQRVMRTRQAETMEYDYAHYGRWFEISASPVRSGGLAVYFRDITDRKRAEQALRTADRQKDEFIATLAHELRNPLAPIRNGLNLLRLSGKADAAAAPIHEMMERQVSHLVRLTDDLLEMSRITRGVLELRHERVQLAAVVRSAVETAEPQIRAGGHRLALELPPEPLWVQGDPVRLAQILANLLNNAARYTDKGGAIWLTARREPDAAAVAVRDTGVGIAPGDLERVFEMFSRGERSSGLGIGLALARRLAEMHGGTVSAASAGPRRGAEFTLRLPLAPADGKLSAPVASETAVLPPKRILVVDDNRDAADSLGMLLRFLGADVQVAHGGREALEAFETYRPSVVLLDLGMPEIDGYQVARAIRGRADGERVSIIALTGWGQEDDRRRSREAGFDHHLIKPADMAALQSLLGSLGEA